jgi:hypothetical protein
MKNNVLSIVSLLQETIARERKIKEVETDPLKLLWQG